MVNMSHVLKNNWQPSAEINTLHARADILKNIRAFFAARHVLEVETPLMCHTSVTDPFIESIPALYQAYPHEAPKQFLLQTSPEYAMKRLLAAGSGCIYQLCKAFRQGEIGRHHNPEFTMLEWYRLNFDHLQLMQEVDELVQATLGTPPADKITYAQLFKDVLGINVHDDSIERLRQCALDNQINIHEDISNRDTWLTLLLTHCIEPQLGRQRPCIIYNFPASQAALARLNDDTPPSAARFEVYYQGIELANGFHELQNADEQRQRFMANNQKRLELQLAPVPIDELLLASLQSGLPDCAGVALGIDRLVMLALEKPTLQEVLSFDIARA
jgi:lysyl-tRNA synthetase class 2